MGPTPSPATPHKGGDGMVLSLRVQPGASRLRLGGVVVLPTGPALALSVTAPPVDGRANDAVITALAEAFAVSRSSISIMSGHSGRLKTVLVKGDPARIQSLLAAWLERSGLSKP